MIPVVHFSQKFSLFEETWSPKTVGKFDNYLVKVAKIKGHFTWHTHDECDEVFIVHKGKMQIDFRDNCVPIGEGEMLIVPRGKEHKPFAEEMCEIILLERSDAINTGNVQNEFTKTDEDWI